MEFFLLLFLFPFFVVIMNKIITVRSKYFFFARDMACHIALLQFAHLMRHKIRFAFFLNAINKIIKDFFARTLYVLSE